MKQPVPVPAEVKLMNTLATALFVLGPEYPAPEGLEVRWNRLRPCREFHV